MQKTCTSPVSGERLAVVGAGIAGLACAWLLARRARVTLFEAGDHVGGHTNTVTVDGGLPVDTGFIVYNERNYPLLTRLFAWLRVPTQPSDMSFAVSIDRGGIEYAGDNLAKLFAQPANLFRPTHWRMLRDILRFNRETLALLEAGGLEGLSLGEYLARGGYSRAFRERYLLPMGGAIWSCPTRAMLDFPARTFAAFFRNHGLLALDDRPLWRTVTGGGREYVRRLLADFEGEVFTGLPVTRVRRRRGGVEIVDGGGHVRQFDRVVLACHADQALALLESPSPLEREVLASFRYQPNLAVLHSDPALMPQRARIWASWNYLSGAADRIAVTYWMNRLQSLPGRKNYFVTLNPVAEPRAELVHRRIEYRHPVFDTRAIAAQRELDRIQGPDIFFAGAWQGYGFHEDGMRSAVNVAARLGVQPPWTAEQLMIDVASERVVEEAAA